MIQQYKGFESKKMSGPREVLPAGGYVCKILSAKQESYQWGSVLIIAYDIIEGDYAGFWKRDFDSNSNEDKKWRGTLRMTIPTGDGSQQDGWRTRAFNNMIACIEESNPLYHWAWDEATLKGLAIGILVRDREWEINGNTGWTTEASGTATIYDIRDGKFRVPKPRKLQARDTASSDAGSYAQAESDDDLPF